MSVSSCARYNNSHPNATSDLFYSGIPLKSTNSCSWIDNYLDGPITHPSTSTMADIFHNGLPADLHDNNLISCYDQSPDIYIGLHSSETIQGCCGASVQATGDPDLGGIGVCS